MPTTSENDSELNAASVSVLSEANTQAALKERITQLCGLIDQHSIYLVSPECTEDNSKFRVTKNKVIKLRAQVADLKEVLAANREAHELLQLAEAPPSVASSASPLSAPVAAPAASTSPKVRFPQGLPTFRSGTGAIHEPREFVNRFQLIMQAHDLDLDRYWARFFPCCLPTDISDWATQRITSTLTWEDAKKAFLRQFDNPSGLQEARRALGKMQMKPGESLSEYTQRFEKQMRLAQESDSNQMIAAHFLETLPSELRHHVEGSTHDLSKPEATVTDLINIALRYSWKPKDTHPPSGSGHRPESTEKNRRPATNKLLHCQLHGEGTHSTEQCRELSRARKNLSKNADKTPAVASASSTPSSSTASTGNVTCYLCKQPGHYANVCPQRDSAGPGNLNVQFATILPAKKADDPLTDAPTGKGDHSTLRHCRPFDAPLISIPVLLDGQRHLAGLDSGASRSLISASLATDLGKVIEPQEGHITFADPSKSMPRIGIALSIHVQVGPWISSMTVRLYRRSRELSSSSAET